MDFVFKLGGDVDGRVGDHQGAGIGRRIHDENVGDAAGGTQACIAGHGHLHQLISVQAALHHGQGIAGAAHGHAQFGGFGFGFGMEDGIGADIQAHFGGQRLHGGFVADERGLDEALDCGFNGTLQSNFRQRPDHGGGEGRQIFASLDELVKDVIVGGMADQRVKGNGFSQLGEIAHVHFLLAGR